MTAGEPFKVESEDLATVRCGSTAARVDRLQSGRLPGQERSLFECERRHESVRWFQAPERVRERPPRRRECHAVKGSFALNDVRARTRIWPRPSGAWPTHFATS